MTPKDEYLTACDIYRTRIPHLLALAEDDAEWQTWAEHAAGCPECQSLLAFDNRLARGIEALPKPGPAYVSPKVLKRLQSGRLPLLRRRDRILALGGTVAGLLLGLAIGAALQEGRLTAEDASAAGAVYAESDGQFDDLMASLTAGEGNGR
ncbi:MAG: hypothetical protein FJY67_04850 [Calditrichaeota bacterium]|nr:hypothetical protein [Calditrichota bacterium]